MPSSITSQLAKSSATDDALDADLGDARRTARLHAIVSALSQRPDATLPEALETEKEREAYYRFVGSEHIAFDELFGFHADAAARRAAACEADEILVLHDTTEVSWKIWDEEPSRAFLARPSSGTQGFSVHFSMAVVRLDDALEATSPTSFAPLGYVGAQPFVHRSELEKAGGGVEAEAFWTQTGGLYGDGGEGERWHEAIERSSCRLEAAADAGARLVHVMDREADAYWLFARLLAQDDGFVVRMTRPASRRVKTGERRADFEALAEAMEGASWSAAREAEVGWRPARNASKRKGMRPRRGRTAEVCARARRVELRRPDGVEAWAYAEHLPVWVVEVVEVDAPEGVEPIHWVLVTNLLEGQGEPDDEAIWSVVGRYRARWQIEESFDALKNACGVNDLQHRSAHTLLNAIAIRCALAWEMLVLRVLAREAPELPASTVVDPVRLAVLAQEAPKGLPKDPTAGDVFAAVARLGGHIRSNGPPGFKVLGRGWRKLGQMARGARAIMRQMEASERCDQS